MDNPLPIMAALAILSVLIVLRRLHTVCRQTTLITAWSWAVGTWAVWSLATILTIVPIAPAWLDQLWYLAMILSLCPPIAVLGAKRPGSRVWALFVLLPLLLVFTWPALVCWMSSTPPDRLQLEFPMVIAVWLVLVMGYGNYLGTRNFLPAGLLAASAAWLASSFSQTPEAGVARPIIVPVGLFCSAAWFGLFIAPRKDSEKSWDRVWRDYQNAFGIVWAKRIMERINFTADKEQWTARLHPDGFAWAEDADEASRRHTTERIDHAMRWLLRRFVDDEWLAERVETLEVPEQSKPDPA